MNGTECASWLNSHSSLNSDFAKWLKSLDEREYYTFVSATEACLRMVPYDKAMRISQQMFAGEIKKPFAFSEHPRVVRENGEDSYSLGGSSQRTIGEMEELRKQARDNPAQGGMAKELRELLASIGVMPTKKQSPECGPSFLCGSSRVMPCPYCKGKALVMRDVGHCPDCLCRFDPFRKQMLTYKEAQIASKAGENRRTKKKRVSKKMFNKT